MGMIFELCGVMNWTQDKNGNYTRVKDDRNCITARNSVNNTLRIVKARTSFHCGCCDEQKGKGMRYIGKEYEKVCLNCFQNWFKGSKETFEELIKVINGMEDDLNKNKSKWEREALIGALN